MVNQLNKLIKEITSRYENIKTEAQEKKLWQEFFKNKNKQEWLVLCVFDGKDDVDGSGIDYVTKEKSKKVKITEYFFDEQKTLHTIYRIEDQFEQIRYNILDDKWKFYLITDKDLIDKVKMWLILKNLD